ncbi:hypothetical protein F5Y11DRAFT_362866 [Daldinia sp. FL1419]|nr:hypothetical protein F5Y11DRAFT_362866 [Daldinia sp. FL1419]
MTDHWRHLVHNKSYSKPRSRRGLMWTGPETRNEYLDPVPMEKTAAERERGESDGSDMSSSPVEPLAPRLRGGRRSPFARRVNTPFRKRPNILGPRTMPDTWEAAKEQRRSSLDRLLNLDELFSPEPSLLASSSSRLAQRSVSDMPGQLASWRNRAYRVRKRVGDFLGRTGAIIYPASGGLEKMQLDGLDRLVQEMQRSASYPNLKDALAELVRTPVPYAVEQGGDVPNTRSTFSHSIDTTTAAVTSTGNNRPDGDGDNSNKDSGNDNDNNNPEPIPKVHQIPQAFLEEVLSKDQANTLNERLWRLRGEGPRDKTPSPVPKPGVTLPRTPTPDIHKPSPGPSAGKPFHISQVSHLRPSYILAQQTRKQHTPSSRLPAESPSPPTPPQPIPLIAVPTPPNPFPPLSLPSPTPPILQPDSSQPRRIRPLWAGAKPTREVWFGVGVGTGRDVGAKKGLGRRV